MYEFHGLKSSSFGLRFVSPVTQVVKSSVVDLAKNFHVKSYIFLVPLNLSSQVIDRHGRSSGHVEQV